MTNVEDLMTTDVVTLGINETLGEAVIDMKLCDVRHLPVVDHHNHLVGILSNRDILRALGRRGDDKRISVRQIMSRKVRTVRPTTSAAVAARILIDEKIGALPVVSEEGEIVGIITETDFLEVACDALSAGRDLTSLSELERGPRFTTN